MARSEEAGSLSGAPKDLLSEDAPLEGLVDEGSIRDRGNGRDEVDPLTFARALAAIAPVLREMRARGQAVMALD